MGYINVKIQDELEQEFRLEVVRQYGGQKGALTQAVTEAIKKWIVEKKKD